MGFPNLGALVVNVHDDPCCSPGGVNDVFDLDVRPLLALEMHLDSLEAY